HREIAPGDFLPSDSGLQPEGLNPHATSLGQTCVHCRRSSTAATRRCLGSVSVPVVGAMLSHPLGVSGLVGHYLTNYLVPRKPLLGRNHTFAPQRLSGITHSFPWLSQTRGYVTYV